VTTQGAWVHKDGETVAVRVDGRDVARIPVHLLEGIVCFGAVTVSPWLVGLCAEHGVGLSVLTEHGRFLGRWCGAVSGNVLLRRTQYRWADDPEKATGMARAFVLAKVANCRHVVMRAMRDHGGEGGTLATASRKLRWALERLREAATVDEIRGIEGEAGREYFGVLDAMIRVEDDDFRFRRRSRRPPMDRVNALLSFVYTLLLHDARSALESVGLDPQVGFLHADRPGRPSLALDLMEELRPVLADRLVLSLVNRRQVRASGFEVRETGGVWMNEDTRRTVLVAWQERKKGELQHPFLGERCTVGALVHLQALLLARTLRGDHDTYPPFFWK